MELVEVMKSKVQDYWLHLKKNDPYHKAIFAGTATPEAVTNFLVNIQYLVAATPAHMKLAISSARAHNLPDLADYYKIKLQEETGHDQWAVEDQEKIRVLQKNTKSKTTAQPDASVKALEKRNRDLIAKDPRLYLAYVFFAEYLAVIAGPEIVEGLEKKCRFPTDCMTVISNHAELDKHHVGEWTETIKQLIDEKTYAAQFLKVLDETFKIHAHFLACMADTDKGMRHAS